jgi:hypothetical protein
MLKAAIVYHVDEHLTEDLPLVLHCMQELEFIHIRARHNPGELLVLAAPKVEPSFFIQDLCHRMIKVLRAPVRGKLLCSEAMYRAAEQDPGKQGVGATSMTWEEQLSPSSLSSENLEGLIEKECTIGVHLRIAVSLPTKRAKKAKLAEAPTGDSGSSRQPPQCSLPQILQKPSTFGAHRKTMERNKHGPSSAVPESSDSKGHPKGPGKNKDCLGS